MSTIDIGDRPFPAIIHVKRGNELRRFVPERTCRMEYDTVHHDYVCTKCGERYDSGMYTSVSDDDKFLLKPMRFCTNCGAKVVRND